MIDLKDLEVESPDKKLILRRINLSLKEGKVHFLMGPNGAGKSTLGLVLMGCPLFKIKRGSIFWGEKNIKNLLPEKRARQGMFLAFQNPLDFEGVKLINFLRESSVRILNKKTNFFALKNKAEKFLKTFGMKKDFLYRDLNFGFSGGEKKKIEILQFLALKPNFLILDEIDSGLDADSLKMLAKIINSLKSPKTTFLIITHQPKISRFLKPDFVHIMIDGKIARTGGRETLSQIEKNGYKNF